MANVWSKYWQACVLAALVAAGAVIVFATSKHGDPERCPAGLVALGPRCCGTGQHYDGDCAGAAGTCSNAQTASVRGCTIVPSVVALPGGQLEISVDDWDLQDRVRASQVRWVSAFGIDRFEVTVEQWARCVAAGACEPRPSASPQLPITAIEAESAAHYCRFAGGRLPTSSEWLWAARGTQNRRYPWGAFGLVCRRAAFGLVEGPCATGAVGPEVPGSRPDGATPEGVHDLAGNVAEWTQDAPGQAAIARGGSYRSRLAPELKALAADEARSAAPEIGFRCAYALE